MSPRQERALIRQVLDGDRSAAEALVRAHQPSLFAYMLRVCGRPEVAEDVTQEAFVRALTHLHRFDDRFRFSTWLFTIAKRLYVNASQRLAPAYDTDKVDQAASRAGVRPEDAGAREYRDHASTALEGALDVLSDEQRDVVVLFYQQEWSVEQISQYLDVPGGTVKSHLHRARRRLRQALEARRVRAGALSEVLG